MSPMREVAAAMTLAGPHRDDVLVAQRRGDALVDLRRMGSQGEQRTAVLALLMSHRQHLGARSGLPILVLANHQDAPGALGPPELAATLGVVDVRGREVHVQGAVATTGVGLQEGLAWLLGAATRTGS